MTDPAPQIAANSQSDGFSFQDAPLFFTFAVAAAFGLSLSYEFGYLSAVDSRIIQFFSFQDAVTSAFHYLVPALFLSFAGMGLGFLLRGSESHIPLRRMHKVGVFLIFSFLFLNYIILLDIRYALGLLAVVALFIFSERYISPWRARKKGWTVLDACQLSAVIAALFFFGGALSARGDLKSSNRDYEIVTDEGRFPVLLMWSGTDILLVRDDPRKVRLIARSRVREVVRYGITQTYPGAEFRRAWTILFGRPEVVNTSGR